MKKYGYIFIGLILVFICYVFYLSTQSYDQSKHLLFDYKEYDGFVLKNVYWKLSPDPNHNRGLFRYKIHGTIRNTTDSVINEIILVRFVETSHDKRTNGSKQVVNITVNPNATVDFDCSFGVSYPGGLYKLMDTLNYEVKHVHILDSYIQGSEYSKKYNSLFNSDREEEIEMLETQLDYYSK